MRIHLLMTADVWNDFYRDHWKGPALDAASLDAAHQYAGKACAARFGDPIVTSAAVVTPVVTGPKRTAVFDLTPLFGEGEMIARGLMALDAQLYTLHEDLMRFCWSRVAPELLAKTDAIFGSV